MQQTANGVTAKQAPAGLRLFRPDNPALALGLAVSHMMTKPAFARLRFGEWSRVLVGQINRRHYHFVLDGRGRVVGFLGWAYTSLARAEAWVEDRGTFSDDEARDGPGVIFNAWSADSPDVTPLLLEAARRAAVGHEMIYFKRYYKDGRSRPVRLGVTAFIAGHLRLPVEA